MDHMTSDELTATVLEKFGHTPEPRLREIMSSLIGHLHAFVSEVGLTEKEWFEGIQFLTQTGQISDDQRQEFILLSDTLGVSMLVDLITQHKPDGATETTVLGPFYVADAPEVEPGGNIDRAGTGVPLLFSGRVLDEAGAPVEGAALDIWQASSEGLYDVQDAAQPEYNLRGVLRSDADGRYTFRTSHPHSYPIPSDGPVGRMLRATARDTYRPAHIHFIITADGFEPLTTHVFDADDPILDNDAVFAVKPSLTCRLERHDSMDGAPAGVKAPYYTGAYDFVLTHATAREPASSVS